MAAIDPKWAWDAYTPTKQNPWDIKKVGHLYRRAAFGASFSDLLGGMLSGHDKLLDKLIKGESKPGPAYDEATAKFLGDAAKKFNTGAQASAWWLYRMMHSPHPLREKITLFWHNHFATSNAKVLNVGYMVGQYDLMYQHALGKFDALLQGMSKDPAMMIWLDTIQSKKAAPNENYARELMELFSLGIGNYTEKDIREAAKAFTGWEIRNNKFFNNAAEFDGSAKNVFGKKGNFKGEDVVRLCLEHKACAPFIVKKLYRFLINETDTPTPELLAPLTQDFAKDFDTGKLVERMLRSNIFFSEHAYRGRIKSPVDYVLGLCRGLESTIGTQNGSINLTAALETLGQNVFHPPSVKGWDGGETWLNGQTLLFRQNLALDLARRPAGYEKPATAFVLAETRAGKSDQQIADTFLRIFLQDDVLPETQQRIRTYAKDAHKQKVPAFWTEQDKAEQRLISIAHLVLTLPEYQLD